MGYDLDKFTASFKTFHVKTLFYFRFKTRRSDLPTYTEVTERGPMGTDDHVTTYLPPNFRPTPSVIYYPAYESFVNVGYHMITFMNNSVKKVSKQLAGGRGKARP
jgi:hypothetical protein